MMGKAEEDRYLLQVFSIKNHANLALGCLPARRRLSGAPGQHPRLLAENDRKYL
jgi:hypothetical protein